MSLKLSMLILVASVLTACASSSTSSEQISQLHSNNEAALDAIKRIDSYYLTPCDTPPELTSEEIEAVLKYIDSLMTEYARDCKQLNGLIEQVK